MKLQGSKRQPVSAAKESAIVEFVIILMRGVFCCPIALVDFFEFQASLRGSSTNMGRVVTVRPAIELHPILDALTLLLNFLWQLQSLNLCGVLLSPLGGGLLSFLYLE